MDVDLDTLPPILLYLDDTPIRAYIFYHIDFVELEDHSVPDHDTVLRGLQNYHPIHYPYEWLLYENGAVIVNYDDINEYYIRQPQSSSSTAAFQTMSETERHIDEYDEVSFIQVAINESFEQAANNVPCSGLTKKLISENLQVTKYCEEEEEEEGELCVVCQVEFESNERVAVLPCKHRYHPRCITQWLVRQNVCPICKGQGLSV
ncbi:hypothetical protein Lser_V15G42535 [Lactuca serriola]